MSDKTIKELSTIFSSVISDDRKELIKEIIKEKSKSKSQKGNMIEDFLTLTIANIKYNNFKDEKSKDKMFDKAPLDIVSKQYLNHFRTSQLRANEIKLNRDIELLPYNHNKRIANVNFSVKATSKSFKNETKQNIANYMRWLYYYENEYDNVYNQEYKLLKIFFKEYEDRLKINNIIEIDLRFIRNLVQYANNVSKDLIIRDTYKKMTGLNDNELYRFRVLYKKFKNKPNADKNLLNIDPLVTIKSIAVQDKLNGKKLKDKNTLWREYHNIIKKITNKTTKGVLTLNNTQLGNQLQSQAFINFDKLNDNYEDLFVKNKNIRKDINMKDVNTGYITKILNDNMPLYKEYFELVSKLQKTNIIPETYFYSKSKKTGLVKLYGKLLLTDTFYFDENKSKESIDKLISFYNKKVKGQNASLDDINNIKNINDDIINIKTNERRAVDLYDDPKMKLIIKDIEDKLLDGEMMNNIELKALLEDQNNIMFLLDIMNENDLTYLQKNMKMLKEEDIINEIKQFTVKSDFDIIKSIINSAEDEYNKKIIDDYDDGEDQIIIDDDNDNDDDDDDDFELPPDFTLSAKYEVD